MRTTTAAKWQSGNKSELQFVQQEAAAAANWQWQWQHTSQDSTRQPFQVATSRAESSQFLLPHHFTT
ncbi:hypothetical protein ACLKA6_003518 [Drosophila palustris]